MHVDGGKGRNRVAAFAHSIYLGDDVERKWKKNPEKMYIAGFKN